MKKKSNVLFLVAIIIVLSAIAVAVILGLQANKKQVDELPQAITSVEHDSTTIIKEVEGLQTTIKEISVDVIREGLQNMGFLVTQSYFFTDILSYSSVKKLFDTIELGFTESTYIAQYDGTVTAGIDFTKISVDKDEENKIITVHVPKAEIQLVNIDPNSFELISEKSGIANPVSIQDFNTSLVELEKTSKEKAMKKGLLVQAAQNGKDVVENFVTGLVADLDYTVQVISD